MVRRFVLFVAITVVLAGAVTRALAATPTPDQALQLKPIQDDVLYDRPSGADVDRCKVEAETTGGLSGWIVRDGSGRLLRRFLDTNRDRKLDLWSYYKDGVEVYRDVDSNSNGKADQYRWLGTAGIRWGIDKDENGAIDEWKMISAEEVTAEVVAALRNGDAGRFQRLLLTSSELDSLGLGPERTAKLKTKLASAFAGFASLASRQKIVSANSQWINFGGSKPGVLPAGTDGSTKDVTVYDNVAAVIETGDKHGQVVIGTLVRVGDNWRVIDLPQNLLSAQGNAVTAGFFFQAPPAQQTEIVASGETGLSKEAQQLLTQLEAIDQSLATATTEQQQAELNERRAELLEKLVAAAVRAEDRKNWIRQLADTVNAAVQSGSYPGGVARLASFHQSLAKDSAAANEAAYVKFRWMNAAYTVSLQKPDADYAKIQEKWLTDLEAFVKDHPTSEDAAEAMLQLALAEEFAGKDDEAKQWYGRIAKEFQSLPTAKKAAGAITRLESVGKSVQVRGGTADGKFVDLAQYRGKTVLVHYWATWCEPCKQEFGLLKDLQAKYAGRGFELIGVNLDNDAQDLVKYLNGHRLPWPQLHEEGGLDSRLANELGILTLPTMILVDKEGNVISRKIHAAELDAELSKRLR